MEIPRKNIFMASKNDAREIKLETGEYLKAVINDLKNKCKNNDIKAFIALIPFARNLIEYTKEENDKDYITLTSCLHIKSDTDKIKIECVNNIFNAILKLKIQINEPEKTIKDMIYDEAKNILEHNDLNPIYIENKIVLSIGIRLKAEEFMMNKLTDKSILDTSIEHLKELYKDIERMF